MRSRNARLIVSALGVALALSACGGDGGDDAAAEPEDPATPAETTPADDPGDAGTGTGEPTLTADPGTTWVEVDGERLTYESAGSFAYACDIGPDSLTVNIQTGAGRDLLLQAVRQGDGWAGQLSFQRGGDEQVQYSASIPTNAERFVVGEDALSFEGTVTRIEDFDAANATEIEADLAANCALTGEAPTAVLGGSTYTFSPNGAQRFDCQVSADSLEVRVNRLPVDGTQLEVTAQQDGGEWLGAVSVTTPEGTRISTIPLDGTGLSVDGSSVDYEGTFTGGPGGDVAGTVSVTCP